MDNLYKKMLNVPLSNVILFILVLSIIIFGCIYYNTDDVKTANILGGLTAGLLVAVVQMLMAWDSYASSEKLKRIQIKEALLTRSDKAYYGDFISNAQYSIDVMGVSGERFMKDFADVDPSAPLQSRIIINLLVKEITVRVIMPRIQYLDEPNKTKFKEAEPLFENLKGMYPDYFKVKYFEHIPAHSIFRVDNECIVGPVFTKTPSRFTPAIRFYNNSPIVKKYLEYFEDEWNNATE